ncbi:DUF2301 domain-containing membrane protein [Altericista sp. CCNU0014]|uniref:DUF2301 domain-containing membrane protein n=1 Tax=Altericista sp. CCNU0014 TaxID=3082949 RepID=UPI00384C53D0
MVAWLQETGEIYQGQFGEFTVTAQDRLGVVLYRVGLTVAAAAFGIGTVLTLGWSLQPGLATTVLNVLFALFCAALGLSLWTIHIYLKPLHIALQLCWGLGCAAALAISILQPEPLLATLYPPFALELIGVGFVFVALTGLFVKEAFCFNRLQAKALILLVPSLLLGHWLGVLTVPVEKSLLVAWAILFLWFALDKDTQRIPPDVGDKTVFDYLHQARHAKVS